MGRLFGTDGVRGVAGEDLTSQLAMDLARAAAGMLQEMRAATASRSQAITPTADPTRYARGPPSFSQPTHSSCAM